MKAFIRRLFSPCIFGHSKDYLRRRDASGLRKECPRCHVLYGSVLAGEMLKDGPASEQRPAAGVPTGRVEYVEPRKKVVGGRFR